MAAEPDRPAMVNDPAPAADPSTQTHLSWHPSDDRRVKNALNAAMDALDERVKVLRLILDDPSVEGLADPDTLRRQIEDDTAATEALVHLLGDGVELEAALSPHGRSAVDPASPEAGAGVGDLERG